MKKNPRDTWVTKKRSRDTCTIQEKIGRLGNLDQSRKKNFREKMRVFMSKSDVRNKISVIHG